MDTINLDFGSMTYDEVKAAQTQLQRLLDELAAVRQSLEERAEAEEQEFFDRLPDVVSRLRKDAIRRSFFMDSETLTFFVEMSWRDWVELAHAITAADTAARGSGNEPILG